MNHFNDIDRASDHSQETHSLLSNSSKLRGKPRHNEKNAQVFTHAVPCKLIPFFEMKITIFSCSGPVQFLIMIMELDLVQVYT